MMLTLDRAGAGPVTLNLSGPISWSAMPCFQETQARPAWPWQALELKHSQSDVKAVTTGKKRQITVFFLQNFHNSSHSDIINEIPLFQTRLIDSKATNTTNVKK